jgi:hypothetical protein
MHLSPLLVASLIVVYPFPLGRRDLLTGFRFCEQQAPGIGHSFSTACSPTSIRWFCMPESIGRLRVFTVGLAIDSLSPYMKLPLESPSFFWMKVAEYLTAK